MAKSKKSVKATAHKPVSVLFPEACKVASLHFDVSTLDGEDDLKLAINARRYSVFLEDLFAWIRAEQKYHDKTSVTFEDLSAKIVELMDDNGIE